MYFSNLKEYFLFMTENDNIYYLLYNNIYLLFPFFLFRINTVKNNV